MHIHFISLIDALNYMFEFFFDDRARFPPGGEAMCREAQERSERKVVQKGLCCGKNVFGCEWDRSAGDARRATSASWRCS